jgi:hypothetical protein
VLFGSGRPRGARAARSAACAAAYSALRVDELQLINQAPKYKSQILFFTLMFKILKYMIQKSETGTRWRTYLTFDLLALGRGSGAGRGPLGKCQDRDDQADEPRCGGAVV